MTQPKHDPHEHVDGCLCDLDHSEHEATPDEDLPAATGGVEARKLRRRATKTAVGEKD